MDRVLEGKAFVLGDDVDTDLLYHNRYLHLIRPEEMADHLLEEHPKASYLREIRGDDLIMVGGKNFGCGSSREHAPKAMKAFGFKAVLALSFSRIFHRNAFNCALPALQLLEEVEVQDGDLLRLHLDEAWLENARTGELFRVKPMEPLEEEILRAGGLIPFVLRGGVARWAP